MIERGERVKNSLMPLWEIGHVLNVSNGKALIFFVGDMTHKKLVYPSQNLIRMEGSQANCQILDDPLSMQYLPRQPFDREALKTMLEMKLAQLDLENCDVQLNIQNLIRKTRIDFNKVMGQQFEKDIPQYGYKMTPDPNKKRVFLNEALLLRDKYKILSEIAIPQMAEYRNVLEMMESNIKNRDSLL